MAEHLEEILDDLLYKGPVHPHEIQLPSPEQLSRKILVKAKKISLNSTGITKYLLRMEAEAYIFHLFSFIHIIKYHFIEKFEFING